MWKRIGDIVFWNVVAPILVLVVWVYLLLWFYGLIGVSDE